MAKIFVDKYGNETTEGPQEGVIGSVTGTHSSAGMTGYAPFGGASTGQMERAPGQQPGRGLASQVAAAMGGQAPMTEAQAQVAGRWFRGADGTWKQGEGPPQAPEDPGDPFGDMYRAQYQDRPMTVQQMRERALRGLPMLGGPPPPPQMPFPWAPWLRLGG